MAKRPAKGTSSNRARKGFADDVAGMERELSARASASVPPLPPGEGGPKGRVRAPDSARPGRPSALIDTRVIYCGDCLEQLKKLPEKCVDLIYIDPPFNSNRNYEVFWGETREKRSFEDRHASTESYINYMRPRCYQLRRILKDTGSFYYHCDWHAFCPAMMSQSR